MKRLLIFLFLLSLINSFYPDPPMENISVWNNGRAIELNNWFYQNFSKGDTLYVSWHPALKINGSMAIAGITPLIDNTTTYGNNTKVIVGKGHIEDHLTGKDGHTACDSSRSPTDSLCDFDYDGCAETEKEFHIFTVIELNFTFRNVTEYVEETEIAYILGKAYVHSPTNTIRLPENISKEIEGASGKEVLTINMRGNMTFVYVINNRSKSGLDCITNYYVIERSLDFNDSFACFASGGESIFFIEDPATNDQWFKSNKISIILLSQIPVYHSKLFQNDEEVLNTHMYDFNVSENYFGIKTIESLPNNTESFIGEINSTAGPLGNSNGFSYLYRFAYSYEKNIGENDFVLFTEDFFGRNNSIKQKIFSRQLSYGNKTETGSEAEWETTRKSIVYEKDTSEFVEILFGILGVLVIILFLRFVSR